jgi:hypothetical protein
MDDNCCVIKTCYYNKVPSSDYCEYHKCKCKHCPNEVAPKKKIKYDPGFCHKCTNIINEPCHNHKCKIKSCDLGTQTNKYKYCENHLCEEINCKNSKIIGESIFCEIHKNIKIKDLKTIHIKCYEHSSPPVCKICLSRKCTNINKCNICKFNGCSGVVPLKSSYCENHICEIPSCKTNKEIYSNYCFMHTCYIKDCKNPGQNYICDDHKCSYAPCRGKKEYGNYCHIHRCHICNEFTHHGYCEKHRCKSCKLKVVKSPTDEYCTGCSCRQLMCGKIKHKYADLCIDHKCLICNNVVHNNSKYCYVHTCGYNGCANNNGTSRTYCIYHTCEYDSCINIKMKINNEFSKCCDIHKCKFCENIACDQTKYCKNHKCSDTHCRNVKINLHDENGQCIIHNCVTDNCTA